MQINKHWIYIVLVAMAIMTSCSVSRRGIVKYHTIAQRAHVTLELDQHKYSMNSQVRVWRNSLVTVSLQPMLGIEVARMEATQDSVWVFDKMNRRYVAFAYSDLGHNLSPKISYKTIQEFATYPIGNEDATIELTYGKHKLKLSSKYSNREYNTLQEPQQTNTNKFKRVSLREILPL
jgi:hypothetical protein